MTTHGDYSDSDSNTSSWVLLNESDKEREVKLPLKDPEEVSAEKHRCITEDIEDTEFSNDSDGVYIITEPESLPTTDTDIPQESGQNEELLQLPKTTVCNFDKDQSQVSKTTNTLITIVVVLSSFLIALYFNVSPDDDLQLDNTYDYQSSSISNDKIPEVYNENPSSTYDHVSSLNNENDKGTKRNELNRVIGPAKVVKYVESSKDRGRKRGSAQVERNHISFEEEMTAGKSRKMRNTQDGKQRKMHYKNKKIYNDYKKNKKEYNIKNHHNSYLKESNKVDVYAELLIDDYFNEKLKHEDNGNTKEKRNKKIKEESKKIYAKHKSKQKKQWNDLIDDNFEENIKKNKHFKRFKEQNEFLSKKERYLSSKESKLIRKELKLRVKTMETLRGNDKPKIFLKDDKVILKPNQTVIDWYNNMHFGRQKMRRSEHMSDWMFDRAQIRSKRRDKASWYFQWMNNREDVRFKKHFKVY